jgi:hypothetical protein
VKTTLPPAIVWAMNAGAWRDNAFRHLRQAREARRCGLPREHICEYVQMARTAQHMYIQDLRLARAFHPVART